MSERRLFISNLLLLIISIITLASSIVLEVIGFSLPVVLIHTIVSIIWSIFIFEHVVLHWGSVRNWIGEISKLKLKMTKAITWLFFITLLSGVLAIIEVCIHREHTMYGGIHGKFAMILTILALIHIIKRRRWYNGRKTGTYFTPTIDNDKCGGCKQCIKHCPANVLSIKDQCVTVSAPQYCSACKKCVATCSKNAIS